MARPISENPYFLIRYRQTRKGLKWRIMKVEYIHGGNGRKSETVVQDPAFTDLGFSLGMTLLQAKNHCKKLNAQAQIKRKEQKKKALASSNLQDLNKIAKTIVPESESSAFVDHLQSEWFGGQYNLRKQVFLWNKCQIILKTLKILPQDYYKDRARLYKLFEAEQMSLSYVEKILRVLNKYGEWYANEHRSFFKKIPLPKGLIRETILEASNADGSGAKPLTPQLLKSLNEKMPPGQLEYLAATLYLGLRPSELDLIIEDKNKFLKSEIQDGVRVLGIYQSKLAGVSKDDRWKWLPLFLDEQREAYKNINKGILKKPLVKTIKKHLGDGYGLYSGRKGFTDLMLGLNQRLEDVSAWLGHKNIDRTWRVYKQKRKVHFVKVSG